MRYEADKDAVQAPGVRAPHQAQFVAISVGVAGKRGFVRRGPSQSLKQQTNKTQPGGRHDLRADKHRSLGQPPMKCTTRRCVPPSETCARLVLLSGAAGPWPAEGPPGAPSRGACQSGGHSLVITCGPCSVPPRPAPPPAATVSRGFCSLRSAIHYPHRLRSVVPRGSLARASPLGVPLLTWEP